MQNSILLLVNTIKNYNNYSSAFKLDKCVGSCNTFNKACVPNKAEDLNVLNIITGKNESKVLTKDISCECKCKFDERKYNSNQKCNNDESLCKFKKTYVKKIIFGILLHEVMKMVNI